MQVLSNGWISTMIDLRTVGLDRTGFRYHRTHVETPLKGLSECICDCVLCQAHYFQDVHEGSDYPSLGNDKWLNYHYD